MIASRYTTRSLLAAAALTLTLAACGGGTGAPEVTPAAETPTAAASPSPTPSETSEVLASPAPVEAARGSRENPLAPGEARKISDQSGWTVSAGATEVHDGYLVLPLTVGIDWASMNQQSTDAGQPTGGPINPVYSLTVSFVSASGQAFTETPLGADIPNDWWQLSDAFEPLASMSGNVAVTVPADQVAGGVWSVANSVGDRVFVAQQ